MATDIARTAPRPTTDWDRAMTDLEEHGFCIVENALDPAMVAEVRTALRRAADSDERYGRRRDYAYGRDDPANQRVWNLPSRDAVFCALAEHPLALHFVRALLGWPALLSSMAANIVGGGGQSMVLHADQGYMPTPWPMPQVVNVGWCIDEFTTANGATLIVPGSHQWSGDRVGRFDDYRDQLVPAEAPAGSALIMDGRLLHTNGSNSTGVPRAGIFSAYTLPIYMPQENWFLSLDPLVRQFGSETLMTLLGFRPQVLGRVNGLDRL